jgi:hypothetical protein
MLRAINPECRPNVNNVLYRLKRLYVLEKECIANGVPRYRNVFWYKFKSIVEESWLEWDEVEAAIDEWETN